MKEIKKVLVAGRLVKKVAFEKFESNGQIQVAGKDGVFKEAPRVNPDDMPKEIPTTIAGTIKLLEKRGCAITVATTYDEAVRILENNRFDGVVIDTYLPVSSSEVIDRIIALVDDDRLDADLAKEISGILLAKDLMEKGVWGTILDTDALNESVMFLLAHGIRPKKNELDDIMRKYQERTRHTRLGKWHWIEDCDDCAVGALFNEI